MKCNVKLASVQSDVHKLVEQRVTRTNRCQMNGAELAKQCSTQPTYRGFCGECKCDLERVRRHAALAPAKYSD